MILVSEMTRMQKLFNVIVGLLLRPWELPHRVKRHKLILLISSQEEMSVRVRKGGLVANSLLRWNFRPNLIFETLRVYIFFI